MDTKTRLTKAIAFFRTFSSKADKDLYKKSVLKFCELVEEFISDDPDLQIKMAEKIMNE
jgi:hypothetical protein